MRVLSVDLTRFKHNILQTDGHPKVNKQSFLSIEMFVKSHKFQPAYIRGGSRGGVMGGR